MILDIQDKLNLLSSPQAWERQITAIELGDIGDLRAVIPLKNALQHEDVEEVIIAIEKALKRIAEQNGFESIEAMILEWERKQREIEELIQRGEPANIDQQDIIQFLNMKITNTSSSCIESQCPFHLSRASANTTLLENLPQLSKDHQCALYHVFNDSTNLIVTTGWLLLLAPTSSLPLSLLQTKTCQNGYLFIRNLFETLSQTENEQDQNKLALKLISLALQKNSDDVTSWNTLFSAFTTEQLLLLKKTITSRNNEKNPFYLSIVTKELETYLAKIKPKYPSLTSLIKQKKEQRKTIKEALDKKKKSFTTKLGFKKKAIAKEEKELQELEQELKQLIIRRKQEHEKIEPLLKQFSLSTSLMSLVFP